jgi:hypothetical protein
MTSADGLIVGVASGASCCWMSLRSKATDVFL